MERNQSAPGTPGEPAADEPDSSGSTSSEAETGRDVIAFDPVPLRYRADGLTPERQREYVEALADTGVARLAAERVGISEQAINRVRRRADARAFDQACAAALCIGARRLVSVAFERAIEGTIKRHTYHGEIVSEERVYDNRLLMSLIGKLPSLFGQGAEGVERDWPGWMEAIEQGLPRPPEPAPAGLHNEFENCEVWEDFDEWRTNFPPPDGFDGYEKGEPGDDDYWRDLTEAELRAFLSESEADEAARAERLERERAARDRFFGFDGDRDFSS